MTNLLDVNQNTVLSESTPLDSQVGGHCFTKDKSSLGMLSHKHGYVLKPMLKPECGRREVAFYDELRCCGDATVKELAKFVPRYHGTVQLEIEGKNVTWLVLDNAARDMAMPCIMDIKVGPQTWDPLATERKRLWEMKKYGECKQEVGFCIPGYQVYDLVSGALVKRDRDYGKTLNGETVKTAIRTFLNGSSPAGLSRSLVLQLLAKLWKILRWFRTQTSYRFYASSLLLVYDAARLEQTMRCTDNATVNGKHKATIGRQLSLRIATGPLSTGHGGHSEPATPSSPRSVEDWHTVFDKVCKTHSLVHNYERDLETMKQNYGVVLKDLVGRPEHHDWVNVKMIDFAHVYHSNTDDHDTNYLTGLEHLVNILEKFLLEATF